MASLVTSRCDCYRGCTDHLLEQYNSYDQSDVFCCKYDDTLNECSLYSDANTGDPQTNGHDHGASPYRIFLALGEAISLSSGYSTTSDSAGSGNDVDGCHDNAFV